MRFTSSSNLAAAAALLSVASASNAPAITDNPAGIEYTATLPASSDGVTGAVTVAAAPGGSGANLQVTFYNLPAGNITYGVYSERVQDGNCATAGAVLNPYGGVSGTACTSSNQAECEIGDLSDKHGNAYVTSAGADTGYFSMTYVDDYLSISPGSESFVGNGSLVVTSAADGTKVKTPAKGSKTTTTMSTVSKTAAATANKATGTSSSTTSSSGSAAQKTAMAGVGAGLVGLAALLL